MNFPEHQKTGTLAEMRVEALFISWGWNVGRDLIDVGYDLYVMPDRDKYQGSRFLVQVKGTTNKKSGALTAQVEKERLRQYAEDQHPVFIIRSAPNGSLYWVHAQFWTSLNFRRLDGAGRSGIRFDPSRRLDDRDVFEAYLMQAIQRAREVSTMSPELRREHRILNSLDPRLGVRSTETSDGKRHELLVQSESVKGSLSFSPIDHPENIAKLHDAVDFGLPRTIEVENLHLSGSPVFEYLQPITKQRGSFAFHRQTRDAGMVRLFPGSEFSITATGLSLEAELFAGFKGVAITNEAKDSFLDLAIRLESAGDRSRVNVQLGFRVRRLCERPLQHVDALRPLAAWSEQVLAKRSVLFEMEFLGSRQEIPIREEQLKGLYPLLYWTRTLGRLHLVAKALNSSIAISENVTLTPVEVDDIDFAYALLKGERCLKSFDSVQFSTNRRIESLSNTRISLESTILFEILEQPLGEIPVVIELTDYEANISNEGDLHKVLLTRRDRSQAWISHGSFGGNSDYKESVGGT